MNPSLLIGLGAGLASAALFASAWTGTALGVLVLFFLSPLPVVIAGLGWGWATGLASLVAATATVGVAGGPRSGIVYALALGGPAVVTAWLAMLSRSSAGPDGQPHVEWYPIGRVVAWASLWAGALAGLALLNIGGTVADVKAAILQMMERMAPGGSMAPGGRKLTAEETDAVAGLLTMFFPWAIASLWFTVALLNLWAGGHVTAMSGRLARPWPDLSLTQLPPAMPLFFMAAVLASFASGMTGLIAAGVASALTFAFMLVGLAVLHRVTRGSPLRPVLLALVYGALMLMSPISSLFVAMVGLAEPWLRSRLPPSGGSPAAPS